MIHCFINKKLKENMCPAKYKYIAYLDLILDSRNE